MEFEKWKFRELIAQRQELVYLRWMDFHSDSVKHIDALLSSWIREIPRDQTQIASYGIDSENLEISKRWFLFYKLSPFSRHILERANQILWYNGWFK